MVLPRPGYRTKAQSQPNHISKRVDLIPGCPFGVGSGRRSGEARVPANAAQTQSGKHHQLQQHALTIGVEPNRQVDIADPEQQHATRHPGRSLGHSVH